MARGTAIHAHLEQWWKTGLVPNAGEYQPWVDSFLNYRNIRNHRWKALAVELTLADRFHDIAGTCDLITKDADTGRIALCDYKTRENPKDGKELKYGNYKKQMGGYLSLLQENYPTIHIDTVTIYYISPKETRTDTYEVLDCLKLYEQARSAYFEKQLPW